MKKILVVGGRYQGKTEWVRQHFNTYQEISGEQLWQEIKKMEWKEKEPSNGICILQFHEVLRQWMAKKRYDQEKMKEFLYHAPWVIVADEIGCGVVPMEKEERLWREKTGRTLCEAARAADEVYRIYCGIPQQIKGGNELCGCH